MPRSLLKLLRLVAHEDGQDLVEYALVMALIVFGATVSMRSLASGMSTAFNHVSSTLSSYIN